MTPKRLQKLKRELQRCRRASCKAADLEALAKSLGRRKRKGKMKEPLWDSMVFDTLFPLSIPHHGGSDIPVGTKMSILDTLEDDLLAHEEKLDREQNDETTIEKDGEDDVD